MANEKGGRVAAKQTKFTHLDWQYLIMKGLLITLVQCEKYPNTVKLPMDADHLIVINTVDVCSH